MEIEQFTMRVRPDSDSVKGFQVDYFLNEIELY